MSMYNVHKFLKKVQSVTLQASDKSEDSEGVKTQTLYLEKDLAEIAGMTPSRAIALSQLSSQATIPVGRPVALEKVWEDQKKSAVIVEYLVKQLTKTLGTRRNVTRSSCISRDYDL